MRSLLLVACTACGRLGFDASGPPIDLGVDAPGDAGCTFGPWGAPQLVGISTTATEEGPALSPDGLDLYFHRYPTSSSDLYVAHRTLPTEPFTSDQALSFNGPGFDRDPVVTAGGHHLFFGSDRDTGGNGFDELWESIDLGVPTKISEIPAGIYGPWVREDELELWYNDGDRKLYVRTRSVATQSWGPPTLIESLPSVGYPSLSRDGREIYVEGNASGVAKIYVATRTDPSQPVFGEPRQLVELEGSFTRLGDPELASSDTELYFDADDGTDENLYVTTRSCL